MTNMYRHEENSKELVEKYHFILVANTGLSMTLRKQTRVIG